MGVISVEYGIYKFGQCPVQLLHCMHKDCATIYALGHVSGQETEADACSRIAGQ